MKNVIICLLLTGFILVGCSPKKVAKPDKPQQQQPMVTAQESAQRDTLAMKPEEEITEQRFAKIETREEISKPEEERGRFNDIHFDFDKYDIRPDATPVLEEVSSWLLKNSDAKILIEGHCDERGTNEYNLALGDRRAKATRDYLIALGIASKRIEMLSYGEENPVCTEQMEECWGKNRRAHFVIIRHTDK